MMRLLALMLLLSADASPPAAQLPDPIPEVTFDSGRYCLPLANSIQFELQEPNRHLVDAALTNAGATGRKITFHKVMASRLLKNALIRSSDARI